MSKHKDKDKTRSRSRSRERREKKKSKKSKRSRSKERKHRRSRSRSRSRSSSSTERRHRKHRREERKYDDHKYGRETREKELEKERLRQIALEFKQSGAFSSIAQQSQSFLQPQEQVMPSLMSSFPTFTSFPVTNISQPAIEITQTQPKEKSQAYLEAVEASKRIAASKNFADTFSCSNSNDSMSNGIEATSNSRDGESTAKERARKKKSRWGGSENDKTFIPGMPTVLPQSLDSNQTEAYLVQLQIEEISRKLRTGELGIASVEERSPSPEPIYSSDGKRLNTREFRTRKRLEEQRHQLILRMQCMNPDFKPPSDYKAPVVRVSDKVLIPQEEHPDINFVGLLIGPRGNTLKAMEKETGAKIIIRGKGSVKEGKVGRKDGQPLPGEDEPLHAFITAANADCVKKAVEKINEVIKQGIEVPEGHNDLRRMQLRELAQLNGTLRETDVPRCTNCGSNEHKSWLCPDKPNVTNSIVCSSCGAAGHISKDCKGKRPGQGGPPVVNPNSQAKIDEEYLSLMAELGEGPPASKTNDSPSSAPSNRNPFSIFERNQGPLKAIAPAPSSVPAPVQQPPRMPQNNWNGQPPPMPPLPPPPGSSFAMPPPPIRPPMWNNQPQIPGTDLPPVPTGNAPPPFVPPPPPGVEYPTSNWNAPLPPPPTTQYPWSNGNNCNFVPPLPTVPPPPPPPGS